MGIYHVILCGGRGKRLAPFTTPYLPKQLLSITPSQTLFDYTFSRLARLGEKVPGLFFYVTISEYAARLAEKSAEHAASIVPIIEPSCYNTATAIFYTLHFLKKWYPPGVVCFYPADHYIEKEAEFFSSLTKAVSFAAKQPFIVTFGLKAVAPIDRFGYLLPHTSSSFCSFHEKPSKEEAEIYISKKAFWNTGIYVASTYTFEKEAVRHAADLWDDAQKAFLASRPYSSFPLPFDKAISEKVDRLYCLDATSWGWDDIGTPSSFLRVKKRLEKPLPVS